MGIAVQVSSENVRKSSFRLSTKNAFAKYVRNRWGVNTVCELMREYDLSEGQAKGVVYGQASQATIDQMLDHPNGGFKLGLLILCLRFSTPLEDYVAQCIEEAEHERLLAQRRVERARSLQGRVASLHLVDPPSLNGEGEP